MSDSDDGREPSATGDAGRDSDEVVVERLPPDEAFGLLAHETRFRILETLNDADDPLAFSELRERVGVDDPGQFNYHLGKLSGRFVRNGDEGYGLAAPGRRIVGAVLSGGYTKALEADPVEMDSACLVCGNEMATEFRDDGVDIGCTECEFTYTNTPIPPGVLEGVAPDDVPRVVDRWLKRNQSGVNFGFCYNCDGRLDATVVVQEPDDVRESLAEWAPFVSVEYDCDRCGYHVKSSFSSATVLHPAIVDFHYDRGVDVRDTPLWDLDWIGPEAATVASRDPLRVDVSVTLGEETRVFAFDEDVNLVETREK
ncbi:winged helix-turn-helix domain-containing protein [Halorussus sp. AFM4]|uniref:winged helix-turn-helix domain-containing protein n=1 Tax=Halorussus sp. AFM4 TaxID=3421651 RepID=UPI003EBBC19D